jgi:hypothetical protein
VERVDRLSQPRLRVDLSQRALGLHRNLDGVLLVRRRPLRRLCPQVQCLCNVQLQLVVPLGVRLLLAMTSSSRRVGGRSWIAMPALEGGTAAVHLKYPLEGNALVLYRGETAYVALEDRTAQDKVVRHPDVHLLTDRESREFEESLPFPAVPLDPAPDGAVRLGDVVSWLTTRLRIRECADCRRRKRRLNKIGVWGWWARAKQ